MSKRSKSIAEMLKMLSSEEGYVEKLEKTKEKRKDIVDDDKKRYPKKKKKEDSESMKEFKEVPKELKRGIEDEFKKIKKLFDK